MQKVVSMIKIFLKIKQKQEIKFFNFKLQKMKKRKFRKFWKLD